MEIVGSSSHKRYHYLVDLLQLTLDVPLTLILMGRRYSIGGTIFGVLRMQLWLCALGKAKMVSHLQNVLDLAIGCYKFADITVVGDTEIAVWVSGNTDAAQSTGVATS